jgi:copper chaperone CopZ
MIELKVTGMTCGKCAASVRRVVECAIANSKPEVDLATGRLVFDAGAGDAGTARDRVIEAIEAAGFGAEVPTASMTWEKT